MANKSKKQSRLTVLKSQNRLLKEQLDKAIDRLKIMQNVSVK